jgi:hypothetical protein
MTWVLANHEIRKRAQTIRTVEGRVPDEVWGERLERIGSC